ncbi:hypothetical protein OJAV_G00223620 [Oryzias javanicus]|uniref:Uncharacterized protein n=1 Tax=Oryzias javanicus TaxID=123683 RepID=A0A437C1M5_ORYJA|nr:hypothetical protein OJAV_G00223620 [Oryzias javanicus]
MVTTLILRFVLICIPLFLKWFSPIVLGTQQYKPRAFKRRAPLFLRSSTNLKLRFVSQSVSPSRDFNQQGRLAFLTH